MLSENRDPDMERKRSDTMKERYKDPAYKEYRRQCSLGRTWKTKKTKEKEK